MGKERETELKLGCKINKFINKRKKRFQKAS